MNFSNKDSSDHIFKEGEVFDAKEQLTNLGKEYHGEEGLQHLDEFKEKLRYQELGFSSVEANLFDLIEKNPDASIEDFNKLIESDVKKYGLTKNQIEIISDIFKGYQEKHQSIQEIIKKFTNEEGNIDSKNLYKEFFNKEPKDEVAVIVRPMTINFCPKDMDDYAYLIGDAFLESRDVNKDDYEFSKRFAGRRLEGSLLQGFDSIITIEHPSFFDKDVEELSSVLDHEEQHALNELKKKTYNFDLDNLLNKMNTIEKITGNKIPIELRSFLISNYKIESLIKDEISAYYKSKNTPKSISKTILRKDNIYDYGFDYNKKEENQEDIFDEKYIKLVENAIIAFNDLLKSKLPENQVQQLLFNEPIAKWPKVVERITGIKKKPKDKEKDTERYISKVINHNKSTQ